MSCREKIHVLMFVARPKIPADATWSQNGTTIVVGLASPQGLWIEENQAIVVADSGNHRIVQYNKNGAEEEVLAGGKGSGNGLDQLNQPLSFVIDSGTDTLVICDHGNQRVMRWSRQNSSGQGEVLLDNIRCFGLAMDQQRNLYVSNTQRNDVTRYQPGDKNGTVVAGGNGKGSSLNQLQFPVHIFVDREQNVYVSDNHNHRVMKWEKDTRSGVIVAGGHGPGNSVTQLAHPDGLFVDNDGTVYVVEKTNQRVTRWQERAQQGVLIAGRNGMGSETNQLNHPAGLSFDQHGNLYVADSENDRVQRFSIH